MINELRSVIRKYHEVEKAWKNSEKNSQEYLAGVCLFEYPSYRLIDSDKFDRLIGFRLLIRTLRRILKTQQGFKPLSPQANSVIVSSAKDTENIIRYISRASKNDVHTYIDRDHMSLGDFGKWQLITAWLPFALRQSVRCITNTNRSTIALAIAEIPEIAFLLRFAKENHICMVYDFLPYEVDSNFMYLNFRKHHIPVFKIPSLGPLATHHKILLADHLALSTPYHLEELNKFRATLRAGQYHMWPPEKAHQYYNKYKSNCAWEESGTIGFYSHGEWIRKAQKHSDYGGRIGEAEEAILCMLGNITKANPELKLRIFPHPRELKPDAASDMHAHYRKCIGHDKYEIFSQPGGTSQHFAKAEIAIAAFSTILYERLYCGFKTLIGNMFLDDFPISESTLNSICFKKQEELEDLLKRFSHMDADTFFETTRLSNYRMEAYPEP